AIPVARQTATTPPRPAACASLAANKRRPRSSKNGTNASKRALIAETSITPQEYLVADQHDTVSPDSFRAFFTPSGFFYSHSVIRTQVLSRVLVLLSGGVVDVLAPEQPIISIAIPASDA